MTASEKIQALHQFRSLMAGYSNTSRSGEVRLSLCALIEACYINDVIDRDEYHSALAYIA